MSRAFWKRPAWLFSAFASVSNQSAISPKPSSRAGRRAPADESEHFSRITIVVDVESAPLEQVIMQLDKLVNVVSIGELSPAEAVERELVLVTVAVGPTERSQVIQLVGVFGGEVVSVGTDQLTVMLAGRPEKIDDFEGLLEQYTVVELQRTGRVALPKLDRH